MTAIRIYDPAMCCSTGVCGPDADDALAQFAAALDKAKKSGVAVDRYTLAHQPGEYVKNTEIKGLLDSEGIDCLPVVYLDDEIISKGDYPSPATLLGKLGLDIEVKASKDASACCDASDDKQTSCC